MHSFTTMRSVKCRTMELCVLWRSQSGEWTRNSARCNNEGPGVPDYIGIGIKQGMDISAVAGCVEGGGDPRCHVLGLGMFFV